MKFLMENEEEELHEQELVPGSRPKYRFPPQKKYRCMMMHVYKYNVPVHIIQSGFVHIHIQIFVVPKLWILFAKRFLLFGLSPISG